MKRTTLARLVTLLYLSLGAIASQGYAQCPSGDLTFDSQAEIDAFSFNFPDCRTLTGNIFLFDGGDGVQDINNLDGLSRLQRIEGSLQIALNTSLTDISGLSNLREVTGDLAITDNNALQSLDGLAALRRVGGNLSIRNNDVLTACCGVAPLLFAEGVAGSTTIEGNANGCNAAADIIAACCVSQVSLDGPGLICAGEPLALQAIISGAEAEGCTQIRFEQRFEEGDFTLVEERAVPVDGAYDFVVLEDLPSGAYQFRAVLSGCSETACEAKSSVFPVRVIAGPTPPPAAVTIYSCTAPAFDLATYTGLGGGATFEWEVTEASPAISGAAGGLQTAAVINEVLTNADAVARTLVYRIVATTEEGCESSPFLLTVTVRPRVEVTGCFACNNTINISLNQDCQAILTLDAVAEGDQGGICENYELLQEALEVVVFDGVYPGADAESADHVVDGTGTFDYQIRLRTGYEDCFIWERCQGRVLAEDKSAPVITCPEEVTGMVKTEVTEAEAEVVINGVPYAFRPGGTADAGCAPNASCNDNCAPPEEGFNYLVCNDVDSILQRPASYENESYPYFTGRPQVADCSVFELEEVIDVLIEEPCVDLYRYGRPVAAIIERTFRYRDVAGNADTCLQRIYFFRPEILLPDCEVTFQICDYPGIDTDNASETLDPLTTETPPYYFNGICERLYLTDHNCQLTVAYEDEVFAGEEGCGVKVIRTWNFLDWCREADRDCEYFRAPAGCAGALSGWNDKQRSYEQVLLVKDQSAPVVSCPEIDTFSIGPFNCTAVVNPPDPLVTEECGAWSWEFELYGDITNPMTGITQPNQLIATSVNQVVAGIAPGDYDLHYLVTDACGNRSRFICGIAVKDLIEPVTICNDDLNVSLGGTNTSARGIARIAVEDVDEGSWDNCELSKVEVRRLVENNCINSYSEQVLALTFPEDFTSRRNPAIGVTYYLAGTDTLLVDEQGVFYSWWSDAIFFTCCDISAGPAGKARIELRAVDVAGNANVCWLNVSIEDKLPPRCTVAGEAILCTELDFDPANQAQVAERFGSAGEIVDLQDNCGATLDERLVWSPGFCGTGTIERIFTATDAGGLTATCIQTIAVEEVNRYAIQFPGDRSSLQCGVAPVDTLKYGSEACDLLAVNRDTVRFEASGDECFKQFITYDIINWCEYDGASVKPTVIPRDLDEDNNLEEDIWLEAGLDQGFVQRYLTGETEYFIVKLYTADGSGSRATLPERVLVRADCGGGPAAGYRIWKRRPDNTYRELCRRSVESICDGESVDNQCWTPGFYQYTQINKVYDNTAPEIMVISNDFEFCAYGDPASGCNGQVDIAFTVSDACTPQSIELSAVSLLVDRDPNQAIGPGEGVYQVIEVGNTRLLSGKLPIGAHRYTVRFADGCGNLSSRSVDFTVIDCKSPAPVCINGVSVELMAVDENGDGIIDGGQNTVWADALVASMASDCSGEVTYSINRIGEMPNREQTSITLTCEDPLFETLPVEVYGWDNAGNRDFCETFIVVEDLNDLCNPTGRGRISGLIVTEEDEPVADVMVDLSGQRSATAVTGEDGLYDFIPLREGYDFSVVPHRDGDYLNGVSTFDLVLISKHILGVRPLNTPYKLIAADANKSGSVTTLDLILLRKLILNVNTDLRGNASWRFVPARFRFPNPSNPFGTGFPEVLNINNLAGEITDGDFIAVKVGDVNLSARPNNFIPVEERSPAGIFRIDLEDRILTDGEEVDVAFIAEQMTGIQGYQFTLSLDRAAAEIAGIKDGLATGRNFGFFPERGLLTTSWNDASVSEEERLFTLRIRAKSDIRLSEVLALEPGPTAPEAYGPDGVLREIVLDFGQHTRPITPQIILHQNFPNPFRQATRIAFELPEEATARMLFHDPGGRLLKTVEGHYAAGYNELTVDRSRLPAAGTVFYSLEVEGQRLTRAMIVAE